MHELPKLPAGKTWPKHMLGNTEVCRRLRESYARICAANANDSFKESYLALEWCRKNGNPHLGN